MHTFFARFPIACLDSLQEALATGGKRLAARRKTVTILVFLLLSPFLMLAVVAVGSDVELELGMEP